MIGKIFKNCRLPYITIAGNKTTFILFKQNKPKFIIKVSKENTLKKRLSIIKKLKMNTYIKNTIPRLIKKGNFSGHFFYIESFLSGHRMIPDQHNLDFHLQLIISWLTELNSIENWKIDNKKLREIKKNIKEFNSFRFLKETDRKCLKIILSQLNKKSKEIKLYISHGDFAHSNILIENKKINVLEFDEYDRNIPLFDFFNFLMSYYFYILGERKTKDTFIEFLEKIKEKKCVENYLKLFGFKSDYNLFFSLFLIDRIVFFSKIRTTIPENLITILCESFKEVSKIYIKGK
jgi:aminoglycoside phosphotransferase (APT) family kinase protein